MLLFTMISKRDCYRINKTIIKLVTNLVFVMFWDLFEIIDFIVIPNEINDFTGSPKHTKVCYVRVFMLVLEGLETCRSQTVVNCESNEFHVHQV